MFDNLEERGRIEGRVPNGTNGLRIVGQIVSGVVSEVDSLWGIVSLGHIVSHCPSLYLGSGERNH